MSRKVSFDRYNGLSIGHDVLYELTLHFSLVQMSALKAVGKPGQEEDVAQVHRIRITLTSRNVKNLEKGAQLLPLLLALTLAAAEAFRHEPLRLLTSP